MSLMRDFSPPKFFFFCTGRFFSLSTCHNCRERERRLSFSRIVNCAVPSSFATRVPLTLSLFQSRKRGHTSVVRILVAHSQGRPIETPHHLLSLSYCARASFVLCAGEFALCLFYWGTRGRFLMQTSPPCLLLAPFPYKRQVWLLLSCYCYKNFNVVCASIYRILSNIYLSIYIIVIFRLIN